MMLFEAIQDDNIVIQFFYLKRAGEYKVKVKKDRRSIEEKFIPKNAPENNIMDFADLEKAIKIANRIYKTFKRDRR